MPRLIGDSERGRSHRGKQRLIRRGTKISYRQKSFRRRGGGRFGSITCLTRPQQLKLSASVTQRQPPPLTSPSSSQNTHCDLLTEDTIVSTRDRALGSCPSFGEWDDVPTIFLTAAGVDRVRLAFLVRDPFQQTHTNREAHDLPTSTPHGLAAVLFMVKLPSTTARLSKMNSCRKSRQSRPSHSIASMCST